MSTIALDPFLIIAGALAFIAGLAWNSAIQATIDKHIGQDGTLRSKWVYAVIVTVLIVVASFGLVYLQRRTNWFS